jgi:hypothetical protein
VDRIENTLWQPHAEILPSLPSTGCAPVVHGTAASIGGLFAMVMIPMIRMSSGLQV